MVLVVAGAAAPVRAAGGAYLVDEASVTPAGHCQLESWIQALSGGQSLLTANPACSTGPVEWTLGFAAQAHPFQHQEAPAVKWMLRDPDKNAWGLTGAITTTAAEQGRQISVLGEAAGAFVAVRPDLAPQLVAVAYDDERQWLEPALQVSLPEMPTAAIEVPTPDVLALRIRPSPRPS